MADCDPRYFDPDRPIYRETLRALYLLQPCRYVDIAEACGITVSAAIWRLRQLRIAGYAQAVLCEFQSAHLSALWSATEKACVITRRPSAAFLAQERVQQVEALIAARPGSSVAALKTATGLYDAAIRRAIQALLDADRIVCKRVFNPTLTKRALLRAYPKPEPSASPSVVRPRPAVVPTPSAFLTDWEAKRMRAGKPVRW